MGLTLNGVGARGWRRRWSGSLLVHRIGAGNGRRVVHFLTPFFGRVHRPRSFLGERLSRWDVEGRGGINHPPGSLRGKLAKQKARANVTKGLDASDFRAKPSCAELAAAAQRGRGSRAFLDDALNAATAWSVSGFNPKQKERGLMFLVERVSCWWLTPIGQRHALEQPLDILGGRRSDQDAVTERGGWRHGLSNQGVIGGIQSGRKSRSHIEWAEGHEKVGRIDKSVRVKTAVVTQTPAVRRGLFGQPSTISS